MACRHVGVLGSTGSNRGSATLVRCSEVKRTQRFVFRVHTFLRMDSARFMFLVTAAVVRGRADTPGSVSRFRPPAHHDASTTLARGACDRAKHGVRASGAEAEMRMRDPDLLSAAATNSHKNTPSLRHAE